MTRHFSCRKTTNEDTIHPNGIVIGIIVIGIGVAWLLHRTGVVTLPSIKVLWPSILIAVGFLKLLCRPMVLPRIIFGLGLMVVGTLLQLTKLGIIKMDIHVVWPVLVIAAGVLIIWTNAYHRRHHRKMVSENQLNKFIMFGGEETRITTSEFEGGVLTIIFSGAELDFTDADIKGDSAELHITAIFGGAEIRVPPHFKTTIQGAPILGGFENKSRVPNRIPLDEQKKLLIKATAIFGGIEINN